MRLAELARGLLWKAGRPATLEKEGKRYLFRVYLEPRFGTGLDALECGRLDRDGFLLLCPAEQEGRLEAGDSIRCGGSSYWVRALKPVYCGEEAVFLKGTAYREEDRKKE